MSKTKTPKLPSELEAFVKQGGTTLHCDDGDWELRIESPEDAEIGDELPARSTVIAENGSGDFLFLRTSPAGKFDTKVFVYWHEENRHETFAKSIASLLAKRSDAAAAQKPGKAKKTVPLQDIQKAFKSKEPKALKDVMGRLRESEFGVEALPVFRKALASDDVDLVISAAECIGKLGPEAMDSPDTESSEAYGYTDLDAQLMQAGGKIWSYSGYANCYSACLDALMKLEVDEEFMIEHVQTHIGLAMPDDLLASLEALHTIGTDESIDLLKRAATFWLPELNLAQAKKVKAIVATAGKSKKK